MIKFAAIVLLASSLATAEPIPADSTSYYDLTVDSHSHEGFMIEPGKYATLSF